MWPPFGALLALELYETGEGGLHRSHAIRLVYNGEAHPHPHPKPKPKPNLNPNPNPDLNRNPNPNQVRWSPRGSSVALRTASCG